MSDVVLVGNMLGKAYFHLAFVYLIRKSITVPD